MTATDNNKKKPRARDLGIPFNGTTGQFNAITDVKGIGVGLHSIIEEEPRPGRQRPVRTGVTAILPHMDSETPVPVYAGIHRFNGNGEMTGSHWIADGGYFLGPVMITNTHAIGMTHHSTIKWMIERYASTYQVGAHLWIMPVIAETYDGTLNDINGLPIGEAEVFAALNNVQSGPVVEGNSGGGTAMITYGYKGGTGTSSRIVEFDGKTYTIGVLVQANHGQRPWLTIAGAPVGQLMQDDSAASQRKELGSIIVVIATDLPLMPHQLQRLARRASIGIGRNGTIGGNNSGDIFLALSTANPRPMQHLSPGHLNVDMVNDGPLDDVYMATVDCVEESVVNAMIAAEDMGGGPHDQLLMKAIPHEELRQHLRAFGRLVE